METIIDQINHFANTADEVARRKLGVLLRDISYSLDDDDNVVHRIGYLPLRTSAVRTAIDLKLFELFSASDSALQLVDIAKATGADSVFLGRFLRYLASIECIVEKQKDTYEANNTTRLLAVPGNQAGICHIFETCGPQYQEMPRYLKKTHYVDIADHYHTVFQDAWKTQLGAFEWFEHHPEELQFFNDFMAARRDAVESWLSVYPIAEESKGWDPDEVLFVNIGGGIGHQCAQFKANYPDVPGRVVLQDLSHSIAHALPTPGVENMVHDFFQPQPIKGAKFYFLRGVLHNHPDERVKLILQNTKAAMGKDSVLLIDEMVLPDTGVSPHVAAIDITMMCSSGSRERTKSQWDELLSSVGFKLVNCLTYKPSVYETVMATVPK